MNNYVCFIYIYIYIYTQIVSKNFNHFNHYCTTCAEFVIQFKNTLIFQHSINDIFPLVYTLRNWLFLKIISTSPCQQIGNTCDIYIHTYIYIHIYIGNYCTFNFITLLPDYWSHGWYYVHTWLHGGARYRQISTSVISGISFPMNGLDIYHE